ncbi:dienelactone hydrolase family protein [Verminephrobacter eiseniae]|uniref:dienelactone hydrolase family protein n=1 Tax=Verminephrobacter eiseniae TaxID=364317 RepID=UPI0010E7562B|nr:alpha/beta hydrolase [Verminephrobacter eiseniae]KAB7609737.1 alpha/beta hydrolase [Verminephrobacter sp. Larva24]MCW5232357.1 alpha/beta hydrolase [Verminephrobacter eiseniae]MCW5296079.1 alpha/beta hydrolase [Verminephrobacter eiseniae]MCW8186236.1 alpha/beta hydrolase [Verminephrobacter eiseniae]MCW8225006.1 alpha/beta hydrolase [Verminephrobacter eiseniae]
MKTRFAPSLSALLALSAAWAHAPAPAQSPQGAVAGRATVHTEASAQGVIARAQLLLPANATGASPYLGPLKDAPATAHAKVPVVVFLHGSSGLRLEAIAQWQQWLGSLGIASLAPDSFALAERMTYQSPVGKEAYEKIHALRSSEIMLALDALRRLPWADTRRLVLAGTSEGAVAVARHGGDEFIGRIIFSWSCEDNYFVERAQTAIRPAQPLLNVISAADPFFSPANAWLGNPAARGHCAQAFEDHPDASVVLLPGAPHTVLNLRAARQPVQAFLLDLFR